MGTTNAHWHRQYSSWKCLFFREVKREITRNSRGLLKTGWEPNASDIYRPTADALGGRYCPRFWVGRQFSCSGRQHRFPVGQSGLRLTGNDEIKRSTEMPFPQTGYMVPGVAPTTVRNAFCYVTVSVCHRRHNECAGQVNKR